MRHHHSRCGGGDQLVASLPLVLAMTGRRPGHGGWGGAWGTGPGRGPWGGAPGPSRRRRGDVRAALLLLLEEEPRNGYGLMQEVERRSDGAWRPSSGSVYPALALLEDEGLIAPADGAQGKAFALTDAGRAHVEEHRARLGTPWDLGGPGTTDGARDLRKQIGQLGMAFTQVVQSGDPEVVEAANRILDDARRRLHRLLAGDDEERGADG